MKNPGPFETIFYIVVIIGFVWVWAMHYRNSADTKYSIAGAYGYNEIELYKKLGKPDLTIQTNISIEKYYNPPEGRRPGSFSCAKELWYCADIISPPRDFPYCVLKGSGKVIGSWGPYSRDYKSMCNQDSGS